METLPTRQNQFVGFPFYIFISLLLGTLAVFATLAILKFSPLSTAVFYILLFVLHIGMYWLNLKQSQNEKWWFFYYPIQTILIIALVVFSHETNLGVTVLGSLGICMIGESLGYWGNTKRSLFLSLFYFGLIAVMLYFLVDGSRLWIALSNFLINGGFIVLFMVVLNQQLAERQKAVELAESLESANAKLAASAAKIESLTLQNERQRMARELHDTLAQGVAGLVLQLEAVKAHLASNRIERASTIVEQAITRARGTLAESRAVIDDLRSATANVTELVREKVERFKQATGIPCELEISVNENQLPAETINHAMNILNESLTNIARHAQATQVKVDFVIQNKNLQLEVRDNGKGFDVQQQTSGHYGLIGMHERARLTGGMLSIESNSSGTSIQFIVGVS
jgi:NarL family two-component system sensor histidine kinase YdfH